MIPGTTDTAFLRWGTPVSMPADEMVFLELRTLPEEAVTMYRPPCDTFWGSAEAESDAPRVH